MKTFIGSKAPSLWRCGVLGLTLAAAAMQMHAQTSPTMYGTLSNFDAVNNTGQEAEGFEIELEGVTPQDVTYTFGGPYLRYGTPTVVPYATGIYVRYISPWDASAQRFVTSTPVAVNFSPTNGHMCFNGALASGYFTSGCEHFGVGLAKNPTRTTYRWLVADPQNPGMVTPLNPPVSIAAPVWSVLPPARVGDPAVVAADVDAPVPPAQFEFGEASWMKVYKSELPRQVALEELLSDNPAVPQDPGQIETAWYLLQARAGGNGKHNQKRNQGALGGGSQSVIRRYEFYKYTGTYDPVTHEATCVDVTCSVPADSEVGEYIGAQMAAANLNVPAQANINVTTSGNGSVSGSVGGIRCPSTCSATVDAGTAVSFTASASSGWLFTGWGGACSGTESSCSFSAGADSTVNAVFLQAFKLSVSRSGKGTVTSSPAGVGCGTGGSCSAPFAQGTTVTLTATPQGAQFTGWAGACSGTALVCTVTVNNDTQVQANFK